MAVADIGTRMPWDEAIRLTGLLRNDPSSWIAASLRSWEHPLSREAAATLDVFDLTHTAHSKRTPKPHPGRPTPPTVKTERLGNTDGQSPETVRAILAAARQGQIAS